MVIAVLQEDRLATLQKSRFQAAKRSDTCSAMLQQVRFTDVQELRVQDSKRPYIGSAVLLGVRFADVQELCFQPAKRADMRCAELQWGLASGSISYLTEIAVSWLEIFT